MYRIILQNENQLVLDQATAQTQALALLIVNTLHQELSGKSTYKVGKERAKVIKVLDEDDQVIKTLEI